KTHDGEFFERPQVTAPRGDHLGAGNAFGLHSRMTFTQLAQQPGRENIARRFACDNAEFHEFAGRKTQDVRRRPSQTESRKYTSNVVPGFTSCVSRFIE